uniref:Serine esterase n=1 Tax=uncultured Chloroflexota bacterium TaxID=166587 RepID=H5SK81_9CHLR|nr:serine esterase [uncultured bacterium]BAL56567.1 serine esterase [uncultured Chloroflexota bacterium]
MLLVSETQWLEFNGWVLRLSAPQGQGKGLALLLHGWTGDENSMWVLAPQSLSQHWVVAPRAPFPTQPSGYSWRPLLERRGWPHLEDLRPAAAKLYHLAEALGAELDLPAFPLDLIGFSQGAATAAVFLLLYPHQVGKAALLSGFLPTGSEDLLSSGRLKGKEVFIAHGLQDEMVPYAWAESMAQALRECGASVTFCVDEVGHKVSAVCAKALQEFFEDGSSS